MKILIISSAFLPDNSPRSFRTTELVKELSRRGHNVTLIISKHNYDYSDFLQANRNVTIKESIKINDTGIRLFPQKINHIINRILNLLFEYPNIKFYFKLPKILRQEKNYDLLISIAAPHPIHWGVARALKKNKNLTKTWVADCGDPYMLCKTINIPHPFYFKYFEKSFCRRADYITVPLETAKAGYYPEFYQKIRVIPQAFNFDEIKIQENYIPNERVTFGYAGTFVQGERDPRPILEYLLKVSIDFCFIVYTRQKFLFDDYITVLKDKLVLREFVSREELLFEMSKMDFLLNLEYDTTVQRPSKLIDYALTKRPILSIYSQNIDEEKFCQFLNRDYSQQFRIENIEDYNIKNVVEKFLSLAK